MKKPPFRTLKLFLHRLAGTRVARLSGVRLMTDGRVPKSLATAIFKGTYELPERILVEQSVKPGDRVLEIGTGLGFVSILCARAAGEGNVLSYEANPKLEPIIRENHRLNGVEPNLRMRAVTRDGMPVEFHQNDNVVSSSLLERGLDDRKIRVEADSIDTAIADHAPSVIVMDIEGGEIDALSETALDGVRDLVIELHPHIVGDAATDDLLGRLADRGFALKAREHKNVLLSRGG